jgi:alkyl hydroperoxide reductase subunit AhpC
MFSLPMSHQLILNLTRYKGVLQPHFNKSLAGELGILESTEKIAYRATFIVDPQGIVRWVSMT